MATRARYTSVISHRSGETEDSIIADIAVGTKPARSRRARCRAPIASRKYNQLLRIEEDLGDAASYPGRDAFFNIV
jgi:enolase